jgi:uncharacterized alpha-E superfamily protein
MERAEATARMIDVHYHFGLESPLVGDALRFSSIMAVSGQEEDFAERHGEPTEANIIQFFAFDPEHPSSIFSCLRSARENARSIRDQISSEMWECLNRQYLDYREWDVDRVQRGSAFAFFQKVKDGAHLFAGVANRTLPMGEARDFFDSGRFLERGDQTARILDVKYHDLLPQFAGTSARVGEGGAVGGPVDTHGWLAVLKSVGAYEAFRKANRRGVSPAAVAEYLILSPQFPASVRHSIGRVDGCLRRISGNREVGPANAAEREVGRLYSNLNFLRAEDIVAEGLHEFLEDVQVRCTAIGHAIHATYLRY